MHEKLLESEGAYEFKNPRKAGQGVLAHKASKEICSSIH